METRGRRNKPRNGWSREELAPELKAMCKQRLTEKRDGDESWWDAMEGEIIGLPESKAPEPEKFVRQGQAEKGLEWVGG